MSRTVKILLVLIVLGVAAYLGYRHLLPSMIAETLMTEQSSTLLPEDLQRKLDNVRLKIDREVKNLPEFMKEFSLGYDDLQNMIDRVDTDELLNAYREIRDTAFRSTNEVYDILVRHIRIEGYDLEMFRDAFNSKTSVQSIREAMNQIEQNELLGSLGIPFAKEMAKKILADSETVIRQRLEQDKFTQ